MYFDYYEMDYDGNVIKLRLARRRALTIYHSG